MRILGVDPGVADTGWAVLEQLLPSPILRLASSGILRTDPGTPLPERLNQIHDALAGVIADHKPDILAVEEMFFTKIANTVRATLQARGVVLLAAAQRGVPVHEYNPRQVKSTLTGSGTAQKAQMQKMIQRSLGLTDILRPDDVADAAAIALCHVRLCRVTRLRVIDTLGGRRRPA